MELLHENSEMALQGMTGDRVGNPGASQGWWFNRVHVILRLGAYRAQIDDAEPVLQGNPHDGIIEHCERDRGDALEFRIAKAAVVDGPDGHRQLVPYELADQPPVALEPVEVFRDAPRQSSDPSR